MRQHDPVRPPRPSRKRRAIELGKDFLILLLTCSALLLAARTGLYAVGGRVWLEQLTGLIQGDGAPSPAPESPGGAESLLQPVRLAVCLSGGENIRRYGVQYDTGQTVRDYAALSGFLGEALASARDPHPVSAQTWRTALETPGLYFDLLGSIPLTALCHWAAEDGRAQTALSGAARHLVLAAPEEGETAVLFYRDEAQDLFYACTTSVLWTDYLEQALTSYADNGARFAYELPEAHYGGLSPEVLILPEPPAPERYQVAIPLDLSDDGVRAELERALGFRGSDYPVPGEWVLRDGDTLRLAADGTIFFTAEEGGPVRYPVGEGAVDVIEGLYALFSSARSAWCGSSGSEGRVCLLSAEEQDGGAWNVTFGYVLDGAPVLINGHPAASFQVEHGQVTQYEMHLRCYTATGEKTLVLPELQAAAVLEQLANGASVRELALCYEDDGAAAQAEWKAR